MSRHATRMDVLPTVASANETDCDCSQYIIEELLAPHCDAICDDEVGPSPVAIDDSEAALSGSAVVGLIAGGLLLLVALAAACCWWRRLRRRGPSGTELREWTGGGASQQPSGGDTMRKGGGRGRARVGEMVAERYAQLPEPEPLSLEQFRLELRQEWEADPSSTCGLQAHAHTDSPHCLLPL